MIPLGFVSMIYDVMITNIVPCKFTSLSISSSRKLDNSFIYVWRIYLFKVMSNSKPFKEMLRQEEDGHNHGWFRLSNLGGCIAVN